MSTQTPFLLQSAPRLQYCMAPMPSCIAASFQHCYVQCRDLSAGHAAQRMGMINRLKALKDTYGRKTQLDVSDPASSIQQPGNKALLPFLWLHHKAGRTNCILTASLLSESLPLFYNLHILVTIFRVPAGSRSKQQLPMHSAMQISKGFFQLPFQPSQGSFAVRKAAHRAAPLAKDTVLCNTAGACMVLEPVEKVR